MFYRFKMAAIWKFSLRVIAQYRKIWRTTFPNEFFDEIWLKLAATNIWNKIVKMLLWSDFIGKTNFAVRLQYVNLC